MNKEFIPYEQALALKELGFDFEDYDILGFYSKKYGVTTHSQLTKNDEYNPAPLYQQAFRWFREKYGLEGVTQRAEDFMWYKWAIYQYNENGKKYVADWYEYKTYEEAELECLKKLIELSKNK